MSDEKMREEFEAEWGQPYAERGVYFIPELNIYGCENYDQHRYSNSKSSAWYYFQKGWQKSREALVIELPKPDDQCDDGAASAINQCVYAIEAAGLKVKA